MDKPQKERQKKYKERIRQEIEESEKGMVLRDAIKNQRRKGW